ncbi:hypothetical protein DSO57_1024266 [Entomophthora muscae]|uniref:Uncharacterized protein n=1 Tax=Entomophthora muscae TaxID=34485 RepID=A0ACC2S4M8_9FUNG|nr:hypothetical protein DSO57_1024266 [Entomophthora muscae]
MTIEESMIKDVDEQTKVQPALNKIPSCREYGYLIGQANYGSVTVLSLIFVTIAYRTKNDWILRGVKRMKA